MFGRWEGYRCHDSAREEKRPWFRVKKGDGILRRSRSREIEVMVGCSKGKESCYRTEGLGNKLAFKIKDLAGRTVAEVSHSIARTTYIYISIKTHRQRLTSSIGLCRWEGSEPREEWCWERMC